MRRCSKLGQRRGAIRRVAAIERFNPTDCQHPHDFDIA
jgi:hypothetical protein